MTNALRTNYFLPVDEFSSETRIQQMCSPVSRGAPHSKFFRVSINSFAWLRSTDLSGKSSGHRNMPAGHAAQLYHAGIRGKVSRSTLADANEKRDWRIYADFAHVLIGMARELYASEDSGCKSPRRLTLWIPPRSTSVCPFFRGLFSETKGRHQTSYRDGSARFYSLRDPHHSWESSRCHLLGSIGLEPAAFYVMDRGYIDFARLYRFTQNMAFL